MDGDCLLATGGYDHTVRLWRPSSGVASFTFQHAESVNALEITPDRRHVAVAGHGVVRFFDTSAVSMTPVYVFDGHNGNVTSLGFNQDGKWMYTGGEDETVKTWDIRASADHQREFYHQSPVSCVTLHPNQMELISGDLNGRIVRWDLREYQCTEHLIPEPDVAVRSITISPNGKLIAAVNNAGNCYVWQLDGPDVFAYKKLEVHAPNYALKCKFSPDSAKLVTTSSDRTARVWDVVNGFTPKETLIGHKMWVWDCAFSADSSCLVTVSSDTTGRIWDLEDGKSILELKGHQRAITAVALSESVA